MSFFSDDEISSLSIAQMVFHLVGPDDTDLIMLEAFSPGKFGGFFLERILAVNAGVPYRFSDASATRERLARISQDETVFQEESEKLAADFQRLHGGSAAKGAFLIVRLSFKGGEAFALLKNDDEKVISYALKDSRSGRKKVDLDAVERTFVENPAALQKSALIRLSKTGGDLTVLDRRNQQKVARYFENFLDAVRQHENDDLTEKLVAVTREVIRTNRTLVSPDVYRELSKRTYTAASAKGKIDADKQKSFLDSVVGQNLPDDHLLVQKFYSALRRARIDATPIHLDASKVSLPKTRKIVTEKQIKIQIPLDVEQFVKIERDKIIIYDKLESQFDDTK